LFQTGSYPEEKTHRTLKSTSIAPVIEQMSHHGASPKRPLANANGVNIDDMNTQAIEDYFHKLTGEDLATVFNFMTIPYTLEGQKMALDSTLDYTLYKVSIFHLLQLLPNSTRTIDIYTKQPSLN